MYALMAIPSMYALMAIPSMYERGIAINVPSRAPSLLMAIPSRARERVSKREAGFFLSNIPYSLKSTKYHPWQYGCRENYHAKTWDEGTVQGLLDWFEVDLGSPSFRLFRLICVLCVFLCVSRASLFLTGTAALYRVCSTGLR